MEHKFFPIMLIAFLLIGGPAMAGPYAPAAGTPGSTAMHMDDAAFVSWATGWENYQVGSNVDAKWQTPDLAMGKAVGDSFDIVSLGRGGQITLTFDAPITDGAGFDFAVFENSFNDTFLELGYVEVSSNGVDYFRFENDSLTQNPVDGFGAVDPTDIDGFGGKYQQGYGTPFDLADLAGVSEDLDIYNISHIRILDIIGDGTFSDTDGDVIYDPYPTIQSAGFDLDAIGVVNANSVPIPGALWLMGSGIACLAAFKRKRQ
jgi:hypothetical protein